MHRSRLPCIVHSLERSLVKVQMLKHFFASQAVLVLARQRRTGRRRSSVTVRRRVGSGGSKAGSTLRASRCCGGRISHSRRHAITKLLLDALYLFLINLGPRWLVSTFFIVVGYSLGQNDRVLAFGNGKRRFGLEFVQFLLQKGDNER